MVGGDDDDDDDDDDDGSVDGVRFGEVPRLMSLCCFWMQARKSGGAIVATFQEKSRGIERNTSICKRAICYLLVV